MKYLLNNLAGWQLLKVGYKDIQHKQRYAILTREELIFGFNHANRVTGIWVKDLSGWARLSDETANTYIREAESLYIHYLDELNA